MLDTTTNRTLLARWLPALLCSALLLGLPGCPEECEKGTKDCGCKDGNSCNSGLTCKDDKCVKPATSCPEGSEGCPCYSNDTCDDLDGVVMDCVDNVCVPGVACPPGSLDCPCNDGACQEGLRCNASEVCEGIVIEDGISIGAASVRACDLLFDVGTTGASQVVFDASVVGKYRKEGSRMALSFTARDDAALSGAVAQVQNDAGTAVDISGITPSVSTCFDRLGAAVADPQLVLQ